MRAVAFAEHAPLLAAGTTTVTVWDTGTWEVVSQLDTDYTYELAFSPDPEPRLAAATASGVGIWDVPRTGPTRRPDRHVRGPGGVSAVHFSPDGELLGVSTNAIARVWSAGTGAPGRQFRSGSTNSRGAVQFAPDGARVAFASGRRIEVWALADEPEPRVRIEAGTGRSLVWAVDWTADGNALLTAGNDGCVCIWDASTGAELKHFDWNIGKLYSAAFASDGLTCAVCSAKGQVVVWNLDV